MVLICIFYLFLNLTVVTGNNIRARFIEQGHIKNSIKIHKYVSNQHLHHAGIITACFQIVQNKKIYGLVTCENNIELYFFIITTSLTLQ